MFRSIIVIHYIKLQPEENANLKTNICEIL